MVDGWHEPRALVVTIIFLAASVHGANSFSILPSSFPKLLTDVFGADYGTFSRELADLGNKMDSFLKPSERRHRGEHLPRRC